MACPKCGNTILWNHRSWEGCNDKECGWVNRYIIRKPAPNQRQPRLENMAFNQLQTVRVR